jgi:threonine aldolase
MPPVGDEEHGEDPTVRELEDAVARLIGKEDAVFMPSGTMANIVSYFVHCGAEGEIIVHEDSHPVYSGYAGPAVPGRAQLRRLAGAAGIVTAERIGEALDRAPHRARLLSLENTHNRSGGSVCPIAAIESACAGAHARGLATHLDGARLLNAVAASGVRASEYCAPFESAWIDLSKGLGCSSGAVLAGILDFVAEARRAKYLFGGVMHKTGMLAAAGLYALEHHVERLRDDHAHASALAYGLEELPGIELLQDRVETNIVYFSIEKTGLETAELLSLLAPSGIRFKGSSTFKLRGDSSRHPRRAHRARARRGSEHPVAGGASRGVEPLADVADSATETEITASIGARLTARRSSSDTVPRRAAGRSRRPRTQAGSSARRPTRRPADW